MPHSKYSRNNKEATATAVQEYTKSYIEEKLEIEDYTRQLTTAFQACDLWYDEEYNDPDLTSILSLPTEVLLCAQA